MKVEVLIPWRGGCEYREAALGWVTRQFGERHRFDWWLGSCDDSKPFNRAQGILNAAAGSTADVFVIADGDVYCDPTAAIEHVSTAGWAIPHALIHRLSKESTLCVYEGHDWRGLPLSTDNSQDSRPYRGNPTGTMFVIRRDVLLEVPPDVRFVGWGHEDTAHGAALATLVGKPWRGSEDLVHLWHPPQPRHSRRVGNKTSADLEQLYRNARGRPAAMRKLVDEARQAVAA
jgi:hypothetical protein